jgi:hypothetical protein
VQGVNLLQGWGLRPGNKLASRPQLQDLINEEGVATLGAYAARAGLSAAPDLAALNRHYSAAGRRAVKDVAGIALVRCRSAQMQFHNCLQT